MSMSQSTSTNDAIATNFNGWPQGFAGGADGELFVIEPGGGDAEAIWLLTPPGGSPPPPPPPPSSTIAADDFESRGFAGGTGAWNGAWSTSGDVALRVNKNGPHSGDAHVRLRRDTGYVERSVDLSGTSNVTLRFYAKISSFEGAAEALVRVSPDGVTYTTVRTFTAADSDNTYRAYEIDLSGFAMTSDFRIVIDAEMDSRKDQIYLDDIELDE